MKLSLCNEVLRHLPFEAQCALATRLGYTGLELAPFTLADDPSTLTEHDGLRLKRVAADHGLAISSLHWLMVKPEGLSIASPDAALRMRSVSFLKQMIDFGAACGVGVLVHGSPAQRSPGLGQSVQEASVNAEAAWSQLAVHAAAAGITYCIEPLSPFETPLINTVAEASAVVDRIGSPALRTMLDLSAASHAESEDAATLLTRYLRSGHIAHVQLNDRNRRGPGQGDTPVKPALQALRDAGYSGWVAIEPFEYLPDAEGCAAFCAQHVLGLWETIK